MFKQSLENSRMKKFAAKAVVSAVGVVCAGLAQAGSITLPATTTVYAQEAMTNTTALSLPSVTYAMGVGRPIGNGFTVIVTPSSGALFNGTCPSTLAYTGASTVSTTLKRQSTAECAYDVQIATAAVSAGDTFQIVGLVSNSHTLGTAGNSLSVSFTLKDPSENSFVDQSGPVSKAVASSVQAVNVYAATSDIGTSADVNATAGPLLGFIAQNGDTTTRANAFLTLDNNSAGAKCPDGTTTYSFKGSTGTCSALNTGGTGTVLLTLTGTTSGVATNKLCFDANNNATYCESGEVFTLSGGTTATLTLAASAFPDQGPIATREVTFLADGVTSLGTSRTFAVSGTVSAPVGTAHSFTDTASKNSTWWVWTANASQLMTPYFTTDAKFLSRYFILNTSSAAVSYSTTCYSEGGAITYGASRTGTLAANALSSVNAAAICTITGATRGSVIFTINAPIGSVKGSYQYVDPVSLNGVSVPLTRPYNNANTTE
jgi:hypothetical protein